MKKTGLYDEQVNYNKKKYGKNKTTVYKTMEEILFTELFNVSTLVFLLPALIYFALNLYVNGIIICFLMIITFIIRCAIKINCQKINKDLSIEQNIKVKVLRNNEEKFITINELVVGDYIFLDKGDMVPADIAIKKAKKLSVLNSENSIIDTFTNSEILNEQQFLYMFSSILEGYCEGEVVNVGKKVKRYRKKKKYIKKIKTVKYLELFEAFCFLVAISIIFLFLMLEYNANNLQYLNNKSILLISIVPFGLSSLYSLLVNKIIKENQCEDLQINSKSFIRDVSNLNTLIINKDIFIKDENKKVTVCFTNNKYYYAEENKSLGKNTLFAKCLILSNSITPNNSDKHAFEEYAIQNGLNVDNIKSQYTLIDEIHSNSKKKNSTTLYKYGNTTISFSHGLTKNLVPNCKYILINGAIKPLTVELQEGLIKISNALMRKGIEVHSFGMRMKDSTPIDTDLIFLGFTGLKANYNEQTIDYINKFKELTRIVLFTNEKEEDALSFALNNNFIISKEELITGKQLDKISPDELNKNILSYSVFCGLKPEQKELIVNNLKMQEAKIGLIDTNIETDINLLKSVDISILYGKNSTIAKNISHLFVKEEKYDKIWDFINKCKIFVSNSNKAISYLFNVKIAETCTFAIAAIFNLVPPITSLQLILVSIALQIPLTFLIGSSNTTVSLQNKKSFNIKGITFINSISLFIPYLILMTLSSSHFSYINNILSDKVILSELRSMFLVTLVITEIIFAYIIKSENKSIFNKFTFEDWHLNVYSFIMFLATIILVMFVPLTNYTGFGLLNLNKVIYVITISLLPLLLSELLKFILSFQQK